MLAKAEMRAMNLARSIELADATLPVAPRSVDDPVVLDLLITRAVAISNFDRRLEAEVILTGALDVARRLGDPELINRAAVNLGYVLSTDDIARAFEVSRGAIEEAKRSGVMWNIRYILGNAVDSAIEVGEWDWAMDAMARDGRPLHRARRATLVRRLFCRHPRVSRRRHPGRSQPALCRLAPLRRSSVPYARGVWEGSGLAAAWPLRRGPAAFGGGHRRGPGRRRARHLRSASIDLEWRRRVRHTHAGLLRAVRPAVFGRGPCWQPWTRGSPCSRDVGRMAAGTTSTRSAISGSSELRCGRR